VAAAPLTTTCCVVGGGPAGMMLGLLLARAGIDVTVLEKHADFLRDFRGDTVHPSTLQLMHELGLLEDFLARPHQEVRRLSVEIGDTTVPVADFTHLPTRCKFIALMPQWEFLDFLAGHAKRLPNFRLLMQTEATGLLRDTDRVVGVTAHSTVSSSGPDCGAAQPGSGAADAIAFGIADKSGAAQPGSGAADATYRMVGDAVNSPVSSCEIHARLVVATDGRHSTIRDAAGLRVIDRGVPMDVLWLRLSRRDGDPGQTLGRVGAGRMLVTLDRGDYWQCAYVIAKGGFDSLRSRGLDAFRAGLLSLAPHFRDRIHEVGTWDDVKLLTVALNRLEQWHQPGLLLIGDAAHAMSPVGGVGINLAVQDAVAAANILVPHLRQNTISSEDLRAVQRRREWPTRATQRVQALIQNRVISNVLQSTATPHPPWPLRLIGRHPYLQRLPARAVGIGVRPEHVRCV